MTSPDSVSFLALAMLALVGLGLTFAAMPVISKNKRRAGQLRQAVDLLNLHNRAIDKFASSDIVSGDLRRYVLDICDILAKDEIVRGVADELLKTNSLNVYVDGSDKRDLDFEAAVALLARQEPRMFVLLRSGIQTGFLGAFLRVPETAKNFERLLPLVITGQENVVRAIERADPPRSPHPVGAMPMPA